ncbi:MAG: DUF3574 domain-containing protein [Alphaproteobacteria bacterium]|nr:DUF3574 domain-containing protein [Alphaproteobacteria bacterium]
MSLIVLLFRGPRALLPCLALLYGLSGCITIETGENAPECPGEWMTRTELFFGLSNANGPITDEQFKRFVDTEVAPKFPEGFTILGGEGAWQGASGQSQREGARVIVRVHKGTVSDEATINDVMETYKRQFQQQSVMRSDEIVCTRF